MIKNNMCEECTKSTVCKIKDILDKFSEDSKKDLGVDITMDACNYASMDASRTED